MASAPASTAAKSFRNLQQLNKWFMPTSYSLSYYFPSISGPIAKARALLVETITLQPAAQAAATAAADGGDAKLLYLHHSSKFLSVLGMQGGAVVKLAAPEPEGALPEEQEVSVFAVGDGSSSITIVFEAVIDDVAAWGLYRGPVDKNTFFVGTHFEPVSARRAFVCVDEPDWRTTISVNIHLLDSEENRKLQCICSGTPIADAEGKTSVKLDGGASVFAFAGEPLQSELAGTAAAWLGANAPAGFDGDAAKGSSWRVSRFAPLERLQTYLLAFAIGEFQTVLPTQGEFYTSKLPGGRTVPVRLYVHAQRDPKTAQFAADVLRFALDFFETIWLVPFPYEKLEAFCPARMSIGGEEHVGLITLTERVLLIPEETSNARLESTCNLIAHEVSHQWFGDAVGMGATVGTSWSNLWLKEAFASAFGAFAAWHYPDGRGGRMFPGAFDGTLHDVFAALEEDSFEDTHAVAQDIIDPAEITAAFDALSYNKGMALVLQVYHAAGSAAKFNEAIGAYLKKWQWKHPLQRDLWQALEEGTGVAGLTEAMTSFASLTGHPVVTVAPGSTTSRITLRQSKYRTRVVEAAAAAAGAASPLWTIPLDVQLFMAKDDGSVTATTKKVVLDKAEMTIELGEVGVVAVNVNEAQHACVRTEYAAPALFAALLAQLSANRLDTASIIGLLDSAGAMVKAGRPGALANQIALVKVLSALPPAVLLQHTEAAGKMCEVFPGIARRFVERLDGADAAAAAKREQLLSLCFGGLIALAQELGTATKMGAEKPQISQLRPSVWSALCTARHICRTLGITAGFAAQLDAVFTPFLREAITVAIRRSRVPLKESMPEADANMLAVQLRSAIAFRELPESNSLFDRFLALVTEDMDALGARDVVLALAATPHEGRFLQIARETFGSNDEPGKENFIRSSMGHVMTAQLVANRSPSAKNALWACFKRQLPSVIARWGTGQFRIQSICSSIVAAVPADAPGEYALLLQKQHPIPMARAAIARGVEEVFLAAAMRADKSLVDELLAAL